jgi:ABC-type sugar transport system permease subunit
MNEHVNPVAAAGLPSARAAGTAGSPVPPQPVPRRRWRVSPRWAPYLFVAPFYLLFAVFGLFPLLFSLFLAFQQLGADQRPGRDALVGVDNFAFALDDEWFWKSLKNTLWLALASGLPQHLVAIGLAVFIHRACVPRSAT